MKSSIIFLSILIAAILISFVLFNFGISGGSASIPHKTTSEGIVYELFYVEDMPCMRVGRGLGNAIFEYDGVTCDWSKWKYNRPK